MKTGSHVSTNQICKLIHTLIPSSSLTLRIIFTHISVILLKVGCSRQMSLRILITRFLTLIPVSCSSKEMRLIKWNIILKKKKAPKFIYKSNECIECSSIFSTNRWQNRTVMKSELLMNPLEHFHDNKDNNSNVFTSKMLSTKSKEKAFPHNWILVPIAYINHLCILILAHKLLLENRFTWIKQTKTLNTFFNPDSPKFTRHICSLTKLYNHPRSSV